MTKIKTIKMMNPKMMMTKIITTKMIDNEDDAEEFTKDDGDDNGNI